MTSLCILILVSKHEGKRQFEGPRHRGKYNVTIGIRGIQWNGVDWIHLDQYWRALVNTVMNTQVP